MASKFRKTLWRNTAYGASNFQKTLPQNRSVRRRGMFENELACLKIVYVLQALSVWSRNGHVRMPQTLLNTVGFQTCQQISSGLDFSLICEQTVGMLWARSVNLSV